MNLTKSNALFKEYEDIVCGGVHSNFRHPVYFERAKGAYLFDVDGNKYLDCVVNNGACILGHGDEDIEAAVREAIKTGLTVSLESELSLKVAKQLHEMIPSAERVRLANTGTEAVMKAIMIARAYTGREKIIKVEGCYHGWFDEALVSVHPDPRSFRQEKDLKPSISSAGIRKNTADSVLVTAFNDLEMTERVLRNNKSEVAALLIEPVMFNSGCVMPEPGYLQEIRQLTKRHDVVLIFDEVITGFRLAPGGGQEYFGVTPDISVFAKAIANGYPLSAVATKKGFLDLTRPGGKVLYGGTYNGQQAALAAASVCLEKLKDGSIQKHIITLSNELEELFSEEARKRQVKAKLNQCAGQFQIYFTDHEINNYYDTATANENQYKTFHRTVIDKGLWMYPNYLFHHGISNAHTEKEIEVIIAAFSDGLDAVKYQS